MQKTRQERRKHPRVKKNLSLKIANEDIDIVTQTLNISASGILCETEKDIPEFTKLKLIILLPLKDSSAPAKKIDKVTCEGIVVRREPLGADKYNIAIFFNRISKLAVEKISRYVNFQISKDNPSN